MTSRRDRWFEAMIVGLLTLPPLVFLTHFAQGPDGAEMVSTAEFGGVLHPSGLPLQAWVNRFAVLVSPATPAITLSWVSWFAFALGLGILYRTLRELNLKPLAAAAALIAYETYSGVTAMAVQPEKYAFVSLTLFLYIYCLVRDVSRRDSSVVPLAVAFSLAISQHSASAFLAPSALLALSFRRRWRDVWVFILVSVPIVSGFYLSLLALRSERPWPDWGALKTVSDVIRHVLRTDFNNGLIAVAPGSNSITGLEIFFRDSLQWSVLLLFLPLGLKELWTRSRPLTLFLLASVAAAIGVLAQARLPFTDRASALGYGERYQLILLPFLAVILGVGFDGALSRSTLIRRTSAGLIAIGLAASVLVTVTRNRGLDNPLIKIYLDEIGRELPDGALFFSQGEIELFSGVPCKNKTCFPFKNMFGMPWYRDVTAPAMDARVPGLLSGFNATNWKYSDFISRAFSAGNDLATPNGSLFVPIEPLRPHLEQRGLVWVASSSNHELYTERLFEASERICESVSRLDLVIPIEGLYFDHEVLEKLSLVFTSAGDALTNYQKPTEAALAYGVAKALTPGSPSSQWRLACRAWEPVAKSVQFTDRAPDSRPPRPKSVAPLEPPPVPALRKTFGESRTH